MSLKYWSKIYTCFDYLVQPMYICNSFHLAMSPTLLVFLCNTFITSSIQLTSAIIFSNKCPKFIYLAITNKQMLHVFVSPIIEKSIDYSFQ